MQSMDRPLKYRFKQLTRHGMWTSDSVFEGSYDAVVREVLDGHVIGQARAAVEEPGGRVIYAIDARGFCTAASIALFEAAVGRASSAQATIGDVASPCHERSRRRGDMALRH